MDRKNSLRRSPITRRSKDGSEEKSIFSDSDSIHSVVDVSKKTIASSFMSLANSIEEEVNNNVKELTDDETNESTDDEEDYNIVRSASFGDLESKILKESDSAEYVSDNSDEEFMKFGSGKRALEHNTSSAFFSTVYCDDDYLSDHRLSDKERSKSASPAKEVIEKTDTISQDSLNSGSIDSSESSKSNKDNVEHDVQIATKDRNSPGRIVENKMDNAEICTVEPADRYRPRDGIPKYVMLPNPFYRENMPTAEGSNRVKFELSSNSDEIIPPEILPRRDHNIDSHGPLPVITVTETSEYSPTSKLKKIFVPSLPGRDESYYKKYNNVNSTTFNTLKKSPEREYARPQQQWTRGEDTRKSPSQKEPEDAEMVVVKHYGDIVERYSEVAKKTVSKTVYLDFEQLKMAAVEDEPIVVPDPQPQAEAEEYDEDEYYENEDEDVQELQEQDEDNSYQMYGEGSRLDDYGPATPAENQLAILQDVPVPNTIPYLKIFGNLSLALFGYWLYSCKDEKLSVPVFGFLLFRFFKTQIWDRI